MFHHREGDGGAHTLPLRSNRNDALFDVEPPVTSPFAALVDRNGRYPHTCENVYSHIFSQIAGCFVESG
jgi:hypothetical protein